MKIVYNLRVLHGMLYEWRKKFKLEKHLKFEMKISPIHIMSIDETLQELKKGKSIARFGDGEMDLIQGKSIGFQKCNADLSKELERVLKQTSSECLIAVPDAINTFENLTKKSKLWWTKYMINNRYKWMELLDKNYIYGNTNVSRCYIRYENKQKCRFWFESIMQLWENRKVVIIEGIETRLGCGNDFLSKTLSIERILSSPEDAFFYKDQIEKFVKNNISKDKLILLALGPTATIIAYDLSECGYQALDIGHCDIEYEWFKKGASEKVAIKGKYTNEAKGGKDVDDSLVDEEYRNQILIEIV